MRVLPFLTAGVFYKNNLFLNLVVAIPMGRAGLDGVSVVETSACTVPLGDPNTHCEGVKGLFNASCNRLGQNAGQQRRSQNTIVETELSVS